RPSPARVVNKVKTISRGAVESLLLTSRGLKRPTFPVPAGRDGASESFPGALRLADVGLPAASEETSARTNPPTPSEARQKLVPALAHAIAIINFLNERGSQGATLAELSSSLRITKSHCRAILLTLVHVGWVKFDERAKAYQLYSGLLASGSSLLA